VQIHIVWPTNLDLRWRMNRRRSVSSQTNRTASQRLGHYRAGRGCQTASIFITAVENTRRTFRTVPAGQVTGLISSLKGRSKEGFVGGNWSSRASASANSRPAMPPTSQASPQSNACNHSNSVCPLARAAAGLSESGHRSSRPCRRSHKVSLLTPPTRLEGDLAYTTHAPLNPAQCVHKWSAGDRRTIFEC
jgi:hypothetical protein